MVCKRCGRAMKELKRQFHKQRKWACPRCGLVTFQKLSKKKSGAADK